MSKTADTIVLSVAGRDVAISNPQKVLFPEAGITKLDLAHYYLSVADGALRGAGGRPNVLVRYPNGVGGEFFFQKRAPAARPAWIEVVELSFPSGRRAEEVVAGSALNDDPLSLRLGVFMDIDCDAEAEEYAETPGDAVDLVLKHS